MEFADCFLGLHLAREQADYDDLYEPSKRDAQDAISQARTGIQSLEQARRTSPDQVQAAGVAMIAAKATRSRMAR